MVIERRPTHWNWGPKNMPLDLFRSKKVFIGVVHLPPLPGSPQWGGDMDWVLNRAQEEALTLAQGGANGIIVENFGDTPFRIGRVEPDTVAAMSLAVDRVKQVTTLPVGVNMLRNENRAFIVVTHYQRLLSYIVPDYVHVLVGGRIVRSGDSSLALELEEKGYSWLEEASSEAVVSGEAG